MEMAWFHGYRPSCLVFYWFDELSKPWELPPLLCRFCELQRSRGKWNFRRRCCRFLGVSYGVMFFNKPSRHCLAPFFTLASNCFLAGWWDFTLFVDSSGWRHNRNQPKSSACHLSAFFSLEAGTGPYFREVLRKDAGCMSWLETWK